MINHAFEAAWEQQSDLRELAALGCDAQSLVKLAFKAGFIQGEMQGLSDALGKTVPAFAAPRPGIDRPFDPEADRCQPQHQ